MADNWRDRFEFAWQGPDPEPDEGPDPTWRQLETRPWSGTWATKIRATVILADGYWVDQANRLESQGTTHGWKG